MFVRLRSAMPLLAYPKAYWYLLIGMLINGTATFVLPFEAIYLVAARHLPIAQAAAIVAVYGGGACASALIGGLLADRIGRRPTIICGLLCLAATTFGLAFASDVWLIALLTFNMGFWISWYRPASNAVIADLVSMADQARANGLLYWAYNIGMAVSPLLASLIVQNTGYTLLFCVDGLGTILFCALMVVGLPETRPAGIERTYQNHAQPTGERGKSGVIRDLPFLCFIGLSLVLTSIYFQNTSTLPADMQQHGFSAAQYGVAISVNGIVVVLLGLPLANLLTHCTPLRAVAISALFLGLGFGLTTLADMLASLPLYACSIVVWTIGEIIFVPVSATVVTLFSSTQHRGIYQGMARTSWGLSACVGPLIGGVVLQQWGAAALWIGCAGLGTLVACGFVVLEQFSTPRPTSEEDTSSLFETNPVPELDSGQAESTYQHPVICEAQELAREELVDIGAIPSLLASAQEMMLSPEMEVYLAGRVGQTSAATSSPDQS